MNDKEIIWQSIRLIENKTMGDILFVDLRKEDLWKEFCPKKQQYLRTLMLAAGLIHLNENKTWEFRLTAEAMVVKKWQFYPNGHKLKFDWGFLKLLVATIVGAMIAGYFQREGQKEPIKLQLQYPSSPVKSQQPTSAQLKNHDTLSLKMIK